MLIVFVADEMGWLIALIFVRKAIKSNEPHWLHTDSTRCLWVVSVGFTSGWHMWVLLCGSWVVFVGGICGCYLWVAPGDGILGFVGGTFGWHLSMELVGGTCGGTCIYVFLGVAYVRFCGWNFWVAPFDGICFCGCYMWCLHIRVNSAHII